MRISDPNVSKLLELDKAFYKENNVFYAEKAFVISSVVQTYNRLLAKRTIGEKQFLGCMELLVLYVNNKVDIYWKGRKLYAKEKGE